MCVYCYTCLQSTQDEVMSAVVECVDVAVPSSLVNELGSSEYRNKLMRMMQQVGGGGGCSSHSPGRLMQHRDEGAAYR